MKSPSVSICIPTYNRPFFLLKAIRSCLTQTYKDFEIIVTDNSESDKTKELIKSLNHPLIRYYKNPENIGGLNNIIKVLKLAKGKYIKFLMDDDLLKPTCLERMVKVLETYPSVGIVMSPMEIINENDERIYPVFYMIKKMYSLYRYQKGSALINKKKILTDFLTTVYPCCVPTGIMYRRECFKKLGTFDQKAAFAIDVEICMRIALEYDFYYLDEILSSWRFNKYSDTIHLHQKGFDINIFYYITEKYLNNEKTKSLFNENEWKKIVRKAYLFASKRSVLAIISGIRTYNYSIIYNSIKIICRRDKFFLNKLLLPISILYEIIKGILSWFKKNKI